MRGDPTFGVNEAMRPAHARIVLLSDPPVPPVTPPHQPDPDHPIPIEEPPNPIPVPPDPSSPPVIDPPSPIVAVDPPRQFVAIDPPRSLVAWA
jgi:fused signal recognition particle receptor